MTEDPQNRPPNRPQSRPRDGRPETPAAARIRHQARWVDLQIERAMARGEFDDLPGAGKPLPDLGSSDPDWWVKKLLEREQITGVLPEALQLRKDDAALDAALDRLAREQDVRDELESFNRRVVNARRQLQGGPPVITPLRDVDAELAAWRSRRPR
ncbi:J-domain-containing protein [Marmoricola sp. RAF53]|uniref:DnaJ family domain-containing protein n=1 Tax=Marmoricola sp. RAF53 TaxID=3233059 RepID=UPI003F9C3CCC